MSNAGLIGKATVKGICDAIRIMDGSTDPIPVNTLADRIRSIPNGLSDKLPQLIARTVTEITAADFEGVTSIGRAAFQYCNDLTRVTIGNGVTSIGLYAFYQSKGLKHVTIGNSVEDIGGYAFCQCLSLEDLTIPNSVTNIDIYAFNNCDSFTSITIPDSVIKIGRNAFSECAELASVTIGNGVTSIESSVFWGCNKLTKMTIGNGVTSIGNKAFHIGSSTAKATIEFLGTTPPAIQSDTIGDNVEKIIVPAGGGEAYKTATNFSAKADIIEEATE